MRAVARSSPQYRRSNVLRPAHWGITSLLFIIGCARFTPAPVVTVAEYVVLEELPIETESTGELPCEAAIEAALQRRGLGEYERRSRAPAQRDAQRMMPSVSELRVRQDVDGPGPDDGEFLHHQRTTIRWTPDPIGLSAASDSQESQAHNAQTYVLQDTRASVAAQVRRDYLRVRAAHLSVDIATRRLAIDTEYRDLQKTAFEAGAIPGSDMEAAHLDYEASIDALKLAQLSLKAIREGLQTRYGHSPSDGVCDASIETRPLAEHPQVRRRQAEANASHAMAEWSEQRPQVKLSFLEIGYSRRASDASDRILFELGIPLWDGAKDEARMARADAYQDRVRVQLDARTVRERVLTRQLRLREEEARLAFLDRRSKETHPAPRSGSPRLRIKRQRMALKAYAHRAEQALEVEAARIDLREALGQP